MAIRSNLVFSAILLSLSGICHAETLFQTFSAPLFQGFYTEISTGFQKQTLKIQDVSLSVFPAYSTPGSTSFSYSDININSTPLVVGLGYNYGLGNNFLLGFGLDYSLLSSSSKSFSGQYVTKFSNGSSVYGTLSNTSIKYKQSYDLYITPGYLINEHQLVYLKLGYSHSSATYTQGPDPSYPTGVYDGFSSNINLSGFMFGLGYKAAVTSHVYVFAEGDYTLSQNHTFSGIVTGLSGNSALMAPTIKLGGYRGLIGVGYKY